jgi:hypothetical protein
MQLINNINIKVLKITNQVTSGLSPILRVNKLKNEVYVIAIKNGLSLK